MLSPCDTLPAEIRTCAETLPHTECAERWRERVLAGMPRIKQTGQATW